MKKRNIVIIAITVILVAVAVVLLLNNRRSTFDKETNDFMVADTASICKVFIADMNNNTVLLERTDDGWVLNNSYRAHQAKINQLFNTLTKMSVRQPVSKAAHDGVVKRLASTGVKVEVYQNIYAIDLGKVKLFPRVKRTKTFYVGDTTPDNMGTYMLSEGAERAMVVYIKNFRGYLSSRFSPLAGNWRDHTIFHTSLANIQSLRVEFEETPEQNFEIESIGRHDYQVRQLSNNQHIEFDTIRVLNLLTSFNDLRFESLLTSGNFSQERFDSIISLPHLHTITLTTANGNTTWMKTFQKMLTEADFNTQLSEQYNQDVDHDRLYAQVNNGNDLALIQYYVFGKLFKPLDYYRFGAAPEPEKQSWFEELDNK